MKTLVSKRRASNKTTRPLPYSSGQKARRQSKPPVEAPVEFNARSWVHEALDALGGARRAFDNRNVQLFRGKADLAMLEDVILHEDLERIHRALVELDLNLPEGAS